MNTNTKHRHQINSFEFDEWMNVLPWETIMRNTREYLYDLWVEGYSGWEIEGLTA